MRALGFGIGLYVCAAFLTGGHYANHRCGSSYICGYDSLMAGMFWPIYWTGRVAIEVTK